MSVRAVCGQMKIHTVWHRLCFSRFMQAVNSPQQEFFSTSVPTLDAAHAWMIAAQVVPSVGPRRSGLAQLLQDAEESPRLLDMPDVIAAVRRLQGGMDPVLVAYVDMRRRLTAHGLCDRSLAAYLARVWVEFRNKGILRSVLTGDATFLETVDVLRELNYCHGREEFELLARSGNYYLFLTALFASYFKQRQSSKGGPGLAYYESFSRCAFRAARDHGMSRRFSVDDVYDQLSEYLPEVRAALSGLIAA